MKSVIKSLEEVAEPLRSEYVAQGGEFHLKVEGDYAPLVEANRKLTEFRDNNRALNTKVTDLEGNLAKFKDIDPAKYTELQTKVTELEKAGVKGSSDLADQMKAAVTAAVGPLQTKLAEIEAKEKAAQQVIARTSVENALRDAGVKAGVDERAMPDYIRRGTEVFKNVDGKVVPRNGEAPIFSKKNVTEELSMEEWAQNLQTEAPFLFKPSKGGGAGGSGGGGGFQGERKVISSDPLEFGRNLEGIAKGETIVQQ